jgi:formyl-CoA transferase
VRGPLNGIKVLDFTHVLSGPYCTSLLVDAGADVVKVEPPAGDVARVRGLARTGPDSRRISVHVASVNHGKRSVVLDLKNPRAVELARRLARVTDVVVENFSPGVMERLGLGLDALRELNPRLVTASIHLDSRPDNADAARRGLAVVAEAESGLLRTALSRRDSDEPHELGFLLGDLAAGLTAYSAITTALVARSMTGVGGHSDVGMFQALLALNVVDIVNTQFLRDSAGGSSRSAAGYGLFRSADGWVAIGVNSDVLWSRLVLAMGRADLGEDPRFTGYAQREGHVDYLNGLVQAWTSSQPSNTILTRLSVAGVPCGRVNTASDLLGMPADVAGQLFDTVDDSVGGQVRLPRNGMGMARPPGAYSAIGADTQEVLAGWLGLGEDEFGDLDRAGIFRVAGAP